MLVLTAVVINTDLAPAHSELIVPELLLRLPCISNSFLVQCLTYWFPFLGSPLLRVYVELKLLLSWYDEINQLLNKYGLGVHLLLQKL